MIDQDRHRPGPSSSSPEGQIPNRDDEANSSGLISKVTAELAVTLSEVADHWREAGFPVARETVTTSVSDIVGSLSKSGRFPSGAPERRLAPYNHIFVGQKPVMSYAMSALIQLTQAGEVVVKARGMAISRAVDVSEVVTKRLGNGQFKIKDIGIGTEVVGAGPEARNISSIEITIGRGIA
jgi:archaea-specific DNA-binding protein